MYLPSFHNGSTTKKNDEIKLSPQSDKCFKKLGRY